MKIVEDGAQYLAYTDDDTLILTVDTYETIIPKGKYEEECLCTIERITCNSSTTEDKLSALKAIFGYLRDKYGRYPGIDNHFTQLDENERQLISTLIERGHIPRQQLMDTEDSLGEFEAHKKQSMQNLIASTTKSRTGFSYSGFLPHNSTMQVREPRSFSKERFAQLLRQMVILP